MKTLKLFTAAFVATFAFSTVASAEIKQIRTEADYMKLIAGKTLVYGDGARVEVGRDGSLKGVTSKGEKIIGAWNWQRRFFCRNVIIGDKELGSQCQVVEIDGNRSRTIRDKGRGEPSSWAVLE